LRHPEEGVEEGVPFPPSKVVGEGEVGELLEDLEDQEEGNWIGRKSGSVGVVLEVKQLELKRFLGRL
jgi:hypothetical protein